MIKCGVCGEFTEKGEPTGRKVLKRRNVRHPYRSNAHGNGFDDPGGLGTQIVKEVPACEKCAD
jgi:hypothetical protein